MQAGTEVSTPCRLQRALRERIPGARLARSDLPLCPELQLWLLSADYPQWRLSAADAAALMEHPPFWSFCWASGQVLARYLLDRPELVRHKTVIDFGAGSGIVAIAAKLAGAHCSIAIDSDPNAMRACRVNAALNGVEIEVVKSLQRNTHGDVMLLADVFYDADNLPLLPRLQARAGQVLVADSRRRAQDFPGLFALGKFSSHTVPDLDESQSFNHVTIYSSVP